MASADMAPAKLERISRARMDGEHETLNALMDD
jgi:hypothetical protein